MKDFYKVNFFYCSKNKKNSVKLNKYIKFLKPWKKIMFEINQAINFLTKWNIYIYI